MREAWKEDEQRCDEDVYVTAIPAQSSVGTLAFTVVPIELNDMAHQPQTAAEDAKGHMLQCRMRYMYHVYKG